MSRRECSRTTLFAFTSRSTPYGRTVPRAANTPLGGGT